MDKFILKNHNEIGANNFYVKKYNELGRETFNKENVYYITDKFGRCVKSFKTKECFDAWLNTFLLEKDPTTKFTDKYCESYEFLGPTQHKQFIPRDLYDCISSFQDIEYFAPYLLGNGVKLNNPNNYFIKDTQVHYGARENKIQECLRFFACDGDTDKIAHILTLEPEQKYPVLKDSVAYEYVRKNTNNKYMNDIVQASTTKYKDINIADLDIPAGVTKVLKVDIPAKFLNAINEVKYLCYFTNDVVANLKRKESILEQCNYVEVFDDYRTCSIFDKIYEPDGEFREVKPILVVVCPC